MAGISTSEMVTKLLRMVNDDAILDQCYHRMKKSGAALTLDLYQYVYLLLGTIVPLGE